MIRRNIVITSLLIIVLALIPMRAFALSDVPNKFEIIDVIKARSVVEVGDALYIMQYNVEYTAPAWTSAFDSIGGSGAGNNGTFSGALRDHDSTGPSYNDAAGLIGGIYTGSSLQEGYGYGIWSIYAPANTFAGYTFPNEEVLCMFNGANGPANQLECEKVNNFIEVGDVNLINNNDLQDEVVKMFNTLEIQWDQVNQTQNSAAPNSIDLINIASNGEPLLTALGSDYANNTILKLKLALVDLFEAGTVSPSYIEETFDTTYSDNMTNYFVGTDLDQDPASGSPLVMLGVWLSMPTIVVSTLIVLMVGGSIAGATIIATGRSEIGMFSMIMIIQVAAFVGMISFAVAAILAMLGALALGYIFFYKSSTS